MLLTCRLATAEDWGDDHVDQPLPQYVTGDECLFCHRKIGATWPQNRHHLTLVHATPDRTAWRALSNSRSGRSVSREVQWLLGRERRVHFLKRTERYGELAILNLAFDRAEASRHADAAAGIVGADRAEWNTQRFADRCAGCHTTAVEQTSKAFSSVSLDCFTCHGDVPLKHSRPTEHAWLGAGRREPRAVVSICGQCHLRGGKSRRTGRPYPTQFVAGDNLLLDFQVDLRDEALDHLPAGERHIFENVRDVTRGDTQQTCLDCHQIHNQSTAAHVELTESKSCRTCHPVSLDSVTYRRRQMASPTCGFSPRVE